MKNKIMYILAGSLIVSVIANVILSVNLINNKKDIGIIDNSSKYYGLYQTTYYNEYNKQMIFTIQLNDDGSCEYGDYIASYSGDLNKCYYEISNKDITITIGDYNKSGKILDSGALFFNNKQLYKVY